MAGTPEKMLEYLLETRIDCEKDDSIPDTFMDDFISTHLAFGMPSNVLCNALSLYYHQDCSVSGNIKKIERHCSVLWRFVDFKVPTSKEGAGSLDSPLPQSGDQALMNRRRVVVFLQHWVQIAGNTFFQDTTGGAFIEVRKNYLFCECCTSKAAQFANAAVARHPTDQQGDRMCD